MKKDPNKCLKQGLLDLFERDLKEYPELINTLKEPIKELKSELKIANIKDKSHRLTKRIK